MKRILLLAALLLTSKAYAISDQVVFLAGSSTGGTTYTTDTYGPVVCLPPYATNIVLQLNATYNSGSSTLDVAVQHGFNDGTWLNLDAFTQVTTTSSNQRIHINNASTNTLPCLRAFMDVGAAGSPNYTVTVKAFYQIRNNKN